jgi:hypothetical protein
MLKILHSLNSFGILGDFFTYFLLQYFQRTMFCILPFFTDCKDNNIIGILKKLSSQIQHFLEQLLVKSGCKDKSFILDSQNLFFVFLY